MKSPTGTTQRLLASLVLGFLCLTNAAVLDPSDASGLTATTAEAKRELVIDSTNTIPGAPIGAGDNFAWSPDYHLASADGGASWKIIGQVPQIGALTVSVTWGAVKVISNSNGVLSAHLAATFKSQLALGYGLSASLGWDEQFSLTNNTLGPRSTQNLQVTIIPPAGKGPSKPLPKYSWRYDRIIGW